MKNLAAFNSISTGYPISTSAAWARVCQELQYAQSIVENLVIQFCIGCMYFRPVTSLNYMELTWLLVIASANTTLYTLHLTPTRYRISIEILLKVVIQA